MNYQDELQRLLLNDPVRMNALYAVQALELSDGWIGAGFVRDAVWDHLHGYGQRPVSGDVDVVWFDAKSGSAADDRALEERLSQQSSAFNWSVKNQARMHQRNGNKPYHSTENALLYLKRRRLSRSEWDVQGLLRLSRPTGWTICLHSVCGPHRYLRSISWLFSASASRKNAGCSAIQACS